jgi:hypothetical protein
MSLKPTFRIKVKVTGTHQEVEISHSEKKDSSDECLLKEKAAYYLRNWERMGRPDPRTLQAHVARGGPEPEAVDREEHGDVISLSSRSPDGSTREDVFRMSFFRAHPEVLEGIEISVSDGPASTVLAIPFSNTGVLLRIAAEHPDFLSALHEELVGARDQWRLKQLSEEKTRALAEAISQVDALLIPRPAGPDKS